MKIFITGASSGLGKAIALRYLNTGSIVGVFSRDKKKLIEIYKDFKDSALIYPGDITNESNLSNACQDFINKIGCPDIVISCAGLVSGNDPTNVEDNFIFEKIIRVNLFGTIFLFQQFAREMQNRGSGKLVGISSIAAIKGMAGSTAYSASKSSLNSYLDGFRIENKAKGVKVFLIAPCASLRTKMNESNSYKNPFSIDTEVASKKVINAINANKYVYYFPFLPYFIVNFLNLLPVNFSDSIFLRFPRKMKNRNL